MILDDLVVEFGAKATEFNSVLDRVQRRVFGLDTAISSFGSTAISMGAQFAAAGAAVAAPLGFATKEFVAAGSALNDMSVRTGVAVESLSVLQYAAELSGGSIQDVETGLRKMSRTLVDAGQGQEAAVKSLTLLGTSFEELSQLTPEAQFTAIADKLAAIENPTVKAAAAMEIFGRSGTMLLPFLEDGANGLQDFAREAKRLGIVMSTQDAQAADELGDRFDELSMQVNAVQRTIGSALAPTLIQVSERMQVLLTASQQWISNNRELVVMAAQAASALVGLGGGLTGVGLAAKLAAPAVSIVGSAAAALITPMGAATAAAVAVAGGLLYLSGDPVQVLTANFLAWKYVLVEVGNAFMSVWTPIASWFTSTVVQPIANYLAGLGLTFENFRDVWISGYAAVAFAAGHWRDIVAVSLLNVQYGVVKFGNDVAYWFTTALPQYLNWFADNWQNLFIDLANIVSYSAENIGKNLYDLFTAIQSWLSGGEFDFTPTALLEGFTRVSQELPTIAARGESEMEAALREMVGQVNDNLVQDFAEFRKQFTGEVDETAAAIPRTFEDLMKTLGFDGGAVDLKVKPTLETGTGLDVAAPSMMGREQKQDFKVLRTAFVDIQALGIGRESDPALAKMDKQIEIAERQQNVLEKIEQNIGGIT